MTNKDTRYHRNDVVKETAKFFVECYGKEIALKICTDSIAKEHNNPIASEHWVKIKEQVQGYD